MTHPGGRPPIFNSPEEMQTLIDKYLEEESHVTICGLAIALGFCSRGTLYEYAKKEEFSDTVKRAMLKIENEYEKRTNSTAPTGPIFVLKNMGWSDKKEVDNTHKFPDGITINFVDGPNSE